MNKLTSLKSRGSILPVNISYCRTFISPGTVLGLTSSSVALAALEREAVKSK